MKRSPKRRQLAVRDSVDGMKRLGIVVLLAACASEDGKWWCRPESEGGLCFRNRESCQLEVMSCNRQTIAWCYASTDVTDPPFVCSRTIQMCYPLAMRLRKFANGVQQSDDPTSDQTQLACVGVQ